MESLLRQFDSARLVRFRVKFALFYLLAYVISCKVISDRLRSSGWLINPVLRSCTGPGTEEERTKNLYGQGFSFDFHVFLSEHHELNTNEEIRPIWTRPNLIYLDSYLWVPRFSTNVSISERIRNNGSLYLHVYFTKSGFHPLSGKMKGNELPSKEANSENLTIYTIHKSKRLNIHWNDSSSVRSCWLPNWTINLVDFADKFDLGICSIKERALLECDPPSGRLRPILYLNDQYNLAKDCIPIDQTESLPLRLSFKPISMGQLKGYLRHPAFEEYFRHPNQTGEEELVREKLVRGDFPIGLLSTLTFRTFLKTVGLIVWAKYLVFVLETIFWALDRGRDVTHEGTKIALYTPFALLVFFVEVPCKEEWWVNAFRAVILIALALFLSLSPFWYLALILEAWNVKKTVAYRAELAENRRESSLSLDLPMVFRTLLRSILLPLLVLWPVYSFFNLVYSSNLTSHGENLVIFGLLALCNCFCYLSWIYWKNGFFVFNLDCCAANYVLMLFASQFCVNLYVQIAFLSVIIFSFDFVCLSVPELLVFTVALFLSDLAVAIKQAESALHEHRTNFPSANPKRSSVSKQISSSLSGLPDNRSKAVTVLIPANYSEQSEANSVLHPTKEIDEID